MSISSYYGKQLTIKFFLFAALDLYKKFLNITPFFFGK